MYNPGKVRHARNVVSNGLFEGRYPLRTSSSDGFCSGALCLALLHRCCCPKRNLTGWSWRVSAERATAQARALRRRSNLGDVAEVDIGRQHLYAYSAGTVAAQTSYLIEAGVAALGCSCIEAGVYRMRRPWQSAFGIA